MNKLLRKYHQKFIWFIFLPGILITGHSNSMSQPIWFRNIMHDCKGTSVIQDYDPGYLITGTTVGSYTFPSYGCVFKTDINGGVIYRIDIKGNTNCSLTLNSISPASEHCFMVAGGISTESQNIQPFIARFNACKEVQWCRLFEMPTTQMQCAEIVMDSSGDYLCLFTATSNLNIVYVARISAIGELLWMNQYCTDPNYTNPLINSIIPADDGGCVLSGQQGPYYTPLPLWLRLDSLGSESWNATYTPTVPYYIWSYGISTRGFEDEDGNYYFAGSGGWSAYDAGCFYQLTHDGQQTAWHLVSPTITTLNDISTTIMRISENQLVLSNAYSSNFSPPKIVISKVDNNGNLIKRYSNSNDHFKASNVINTSDGKILYCGSRMTEIQPLTEWEYDASIEKYDPSLQGGSLDLILRVYDSLCPDPIYSSIINISGDCSTVSLPEETEADKFSQLKIFPNPADGRINIIVPDYRITSKCLGSIDRTQYESIKGMVVLSLYSLNGKLVSAESIDASRKNHIIDLQGFESGLYTLRLTQNGTRIASSNFIILHK